jgi:hypothetical protein
MQPNLNTIEKLTEFQLRDKLLNHRLTPFFNDTADQLIKGVRNGNTAKQQKRILRSALADLNIRDYDTEEREFICQLLFELAYMVGINYSDELNNWLYGSAPTTLMKLAKLLRPERLAGKVSRPCCNCGASLDIAIMRKQNGIPDHIWLIVKCSACTELNLLSPGPNIKQMRYGNFKQIETLLKEEFTYEQALTRLEQIKLFRKA